MVFAIKYEVSEKDRHKVISGSYEVKSDEETFRGLAGKIYLLCRFLLCLHEWLLPALDVSLQKLI